MQGKPSRWQLWQSLRPPSHRTFLSRQGTQVVDGRFSRCSLPPPPAAAGASVVGSVAGAGWPFMWAPAAACRSRAGHLLAETAGGGKKAVSRQWPSPIGRIEKGLKGGDEEESL